MASVEAEAPSRHQSADRSPSPVDRSPSPPRRDRSLSRDSRVSRDSRDSRDISPPRRDRSVSRDSRDSRDASPPPRDRSLSRGPRDSRDISPIPRDRSRDQSRDQSRDRSPPRRQSPPPPARRDADRYRPAKRERTPPPPPPPVKSEEEKLADARAEYQKLLNLRSQGVYLPPQKLRALQAAITDKTTKEYQRMAWDALKKSINGLVNKINTANIKFVVPELFGENLIRGRGLFCQSLLKAQHASLPFTPIYACLAAICNTKLPQVGELLVKRLIMRFRKGFKRNDKAVCLSATMFIAHLVNNQVVHENLAAQILILLLQKPTDDSVEIAVGLMREVGLFLEEMKPKVAHIVFDRFRNILHEADIDRRTQYMIEVLFQVRKDKYKDNPVIKEELDLVEEEDQITHQIGLDDDINTQDSLNVFKYDPDWEANEEEYKKLKADILGEGSDDEDEDESESESESEDEEQKAVEIKDQSNADLVNLRRTIYLTIQSSADPEEAAHKLMKLRLPAGQESELVSMIIESCAQEKVYLKFMGLLGERFARLNRMWTDLFEESFMKYYSTIHRYETNKLRNIARFFGHLLSSDAIGWHVFSAVRLTEDDTTSSSRIFLSILLEDLQENMGTAKLKARMSDEMLQPSLEGMFPHDNPRNTRFAINYFTAVKMGFLTDEMRTFLANMPKPALPAAPPPESDSDSASSYSSYSRSSYSSRSRSRTPRKAIDRGRSISRTPPRRTRDRSYSRSYTRSVSSRRSLSRSPPPRRGRDLSRDRSLSRTPSRSRSPSYSRSPPPRRGRPRTRSRSYSRSISRSRSPPAAAGPSKRRRADSYSVSRSPPPPARRQRRYSRSPSVMSRDSRSPSRPRSPARFRSRSPVPRNGGGGGAGGDRGYQRDVSPPPASGPGQAGRGRGRGYSYSRSRSPLPLPAERRGGGGVGGGRDGYGSGYRDRDDRGYRGRQYSPSRSRSRSPLPPADARPASMAGRGRRDSRSPARSPAGGGKRRRYDSSSRSRSPPRGSAKRGRVD